MLQMFYRFTNLGPVSKWFTEVPNFVPTNMPSTRYIQGTLIITTVFITKDVAVKSNLLNFIKKLDFDPSKA